MTPECPPTFFWFQGLSTSAKLLVLTRSYQIDTEKDKQMKFLNISTKNRQSCQLIHQICTKVNPSASNLWFDPNLYVTHRWCYTSRLWLWQWRWWCETGEICHRMLQLSRNSVYWQMSWNHGLSRVRDSDSSFVLCFQSDSLEQEGMEYDWLKYQVTIS